MVVSDAGNRDRSSDTQGSQTSHSLPIDHRLRIHVGVVVIVMQLNEQVAGSSRDKELFCQFPDELDLAVVGIDDT